VTDAGLAADRVWPAGPSEPRQRLRDSPAPVV